MALGIRPIVWVPAIITLGVTLLRLVGEIQNWSETFFNREPGGGSALIGIVWLVPIFGIYFAWKLARSGEASGISPWKAVGLSVAALVAVFALGSIGFVILGDTSLLALGLFSLFSLLALPIIRMAWKQLYSVLLQYGLAARIPVVVVMFFAIAGSWNTHYDAVPDTFPEMNWFVKWIVAGVLPQMTIWIAFTLIFGMFFGGLTLWVARKTS